METRVIEVTPELAQSYLQRNLESNRQVNHNRVVQYAKDMKSGAWSTTHQGIAFDTRGRLIDGQHRLLAIVEAGVPVKLSVTKNAPADAFNHVDLGFGRTNSYVLRTSGEPLSDSMSVAVARAIEFGVGTASAKRQSVFELGAIIDKHRNAILFVLGDRQGIPRKLGVAPVLAAMARAYYKEADRVRLNEFKAVLYSGLVTNPATDCSAIALRDYLKEVSGTSSSLRNEVFLKTQRAIKAFMSKEKLTKIYTPNQEPYPL